MSGPLKLIVPAAFFLAFAFAHHMAVQQDAETIRLTAASEDLSAGTVLRANHLAEVSVQGPESLFRTFVPWGDRGQAVLLSELKRDVKRGELFSLADMQSPEKEAPALATNEVGVHVSLDQVNYADGQLKLGVWIGFLLQQTDGKTELVQPFRVVGVGNQVSEASDERERRANAKILTIAVPYDGKTGGGLDPTALRLISAARGDRNQPEKILALVILSPEVQRRMTTPVSNVPRPSPPPPPAATSPAAPSTTEPPPS
ncbi:hypothetical protein [Planctomyces sp. SH-PL14]|uniref:hypothetical protein n=1 Tax=Planctomyces sp. SH-PL14 TaxID=1632864 RepID=UPI00078C51F9|nr:hypothetical protein [Planctomyces sp. SH-PL14]AMV22509.1 hypothetical protein VT03_31730 [Planctomyces sp. SH-PL14]